MYRKIISPFNPTSIFIKRLTDQAVIPLDRDNTDYQMFRADMRLTAELQDENGVLMNSSQVAAFIQGLP